MKAVGVFPAERRYDLIDHPEPHITAPHQVKLRVLEVGICGTDKEIVAFQYGNPPDGSPYLILGHESLAEVVDVGSNIANFKPATSPSPPCAAPAAT
ncbi:MAG: alcohol dehydrogenase catalytic domain-containing protein [Acidobacteriota bacterium]